MFCAADAIFGATHFDDQLPKSSVVQQLGQSELFTRKTKHDHCSHQTPSVVVKKTGAASFPSSALC